MVEHEAGRCGPLPVWVRTALAAKQFDATPWDVLAQDDWQFWVEAGMLLRSIESEANERARKKTS